jgi:quercetin dioxygenase-like cupin family protein
VKARPVRDGLVRIAREEYADALPHDRHVFLVGDLRRPTAYPFIRDERVELVLVAYGPGDDGRAHWHERVTEYELVLEGEIGYLEIATGETHWFTAGDLVAIPPGACVRRRVRGPARGVTVKVPSLAAKVHCDGCPRECAWRCEPFGTQPPP